MTGAIDTRAHPQHRHQEAEPNLDYTWIAAGVEKRRSNFSNVICFESKDPIRRRQIKAHLSSHFEYAEAPVYTYDRWNGLRRLNRESGRFEPVTLGQREGSYGDLAGLQNEIVDLGQALKQMDRILKTQCAILFLEELEAPREDFKDPHLAYALRAWAYDPTVMEHGSLVVLLTGSIKQVVDEVTAELLALKRAPLAQPPEREHLVVKLARQFEVSLDEIKDMLVLTTAGLTLHQLESAMLEAWHTTSKFSPETIKELKAEFIQRSELVEIEEPDPRGFKAVGGYQAVKRFVQEQITQALKERERAERFGVPLPRGILLFGPPGTGKTLFAKALAQETNLPFINFRTENLYSKWLGESGQRFAEAIRLAEQMSPAIVFIDEIDRFGRRTGGGSDGASQETHRVFSQVLEWLGDEGRRAIIVGTTNEPGHLDPAFLREGRFDYKIPFLYPGEEARQEILKIHLGLTGMKLRPPWGLSDEKLGELVEEVAQQTRGCTGAELEQLCLRARRNAFNSERDEMVAEDLRKALGTFRLDPGKREEDRQRYLRMAEEHANDADFLEELAKER